MIKLYNYQTNYLAELPKNIIMSADVGLGKSLMALEHYRRHSYGYHLVIVAPASKVKSGDWQREVSRIFGDDEISGVSYAVISYEMFTRQWQTMSPPESTAYIFDEGHYAKSATSKRGKAVQKAALLSRQAIFLTATPLPNGWTDMENYAVIFGLAKNKTDFVRRFQIWDRSRSFPILVGYRDEHVMKQFWNKVSKPLEREGNLDLPESITVGRSISASTATMTEYRRAHKERTTPDGELLDSHMKLFAYQRQLLTGDRLATLEEILASTNEHVVIFYNFNTEREAIRDLISSKFKKKHVFEQSGQLSELPKRSEWDGMKPSVTLAQYQSASTAIELTYASVMVFFSPTYSYANFHQAKGRIDRNGQKKKPLFYLLRVVGTIDDAVYAALKGKRDFSEQLYNKTLDNKLGTE